jgi:hypothetical protein
LEPRAIKCIFFGYGSGIKGYRLWDTESKKAITCRSVVFNESFILSHALIQSSRTSSVEVENFINSTPDVDAPIAENSMVDDSSTIIPYSSPVVQSSERSLATNRSRRPHV